MNEIAIESLLGKGLLKEKFDRQKDDLVHNLTKEGFTEVVDMLKDPLWRRVYLLMKKGVPEAQINYFIDQWEKNQSI